MTPQSGPRPSDKWIPWYIVLFFAVQFVGFGWFYHLASASYSGLVTDQAYEKGLRYNQTIAKAELQEQLGWGAVITKNGNGVQLILRDAEKKLLSGARVYLWLVRPVHGGIDQEHEMKEVKPGIYYAPVVLPEKGLWEARIEAHKGEHSYQATRRMEF